MATRNPTTQKSPATSRTCLCSPTTHPGSFRCHLHRNCSNFKSNQRARGSDQKYLEMAVMAKVNSLKALLLQMIKPSSHDLQRRRDFHPKPSRFSLSSNNHNGSNNLGSGPYGVPVS